MTEAIVTYLNAVIDTVGRVDKRYCMAELRSDGVTTVPYSYVGTGNVQPIDIDGGSLSYWRLPDSISFAQIEAQYGKARLSGTYPLRLVIMARRKDSTVDDGFMPTRLAEDIANALTGAHPNLKLLLKANTVSISVGSIDTNITSVWAAEFQGTGVSDPNYNRVIMALTVSVTVVGDRACWDNECDYDPDILHLFDFCKADVVARLTTEQIACLEAALCDPCADATVTVNTSPFGTVPSGGALDVPVKNSAGTGIGSKVGANWQIDPIRLYLNGNPEDLFPVEAELFLNVTRDGVAYAPTYDSGTKTINVVSPAVAYPTTALPMKTGQVVSYATGDDGDIQAGRDVDVNTLAENNYFGNTSRFTDVLGGQTYANDVLIDWASFEKSTGKVLMWKRTPGTGTWAAGIAACQLLATGGFGGWRMANYKECEMVVNLMASGSAYGMSHAPWNSIANAMWTSTTNPNGPAYAYYMALSTNGLSWLNKLTSIYYWAIRTGNISEL